MLRPPRFKDPVDIEAHIRLLPSTATCKGIFFSGMLEQARKAVPGADPFALAGVRRRHYLPFLDYPEAELLRLAGAAAQIIYPSQPLGEGLRRMGQRAYDILFDTPFGRMIFSVLGLNVERVMLLGPKGWSFTLNFGEVRAERVGDCHIRYEFRNLPILLETYQIGVLEGAMHHYGLNPIVLIDLRDLANATVDIRWTYLVGATGRRPTH